MTPGIVTQSKKRYYDGDPPRSKTVASQNDDMSPQKTVTFVDKPLPVFYKRLVFVKSKSVAFLILKS